MMTRFDRALTIRAHILSSPNAMWEPVFGELEGRRTRGHGWEAKHWAHSADGRIACDQLAGVADAPPPGILNILDLYVEGVKLKALSMDRGRTQVHLRSMQRGDWEANLFGLPAYQKRERKTPERQHNRFYTPASMAKLMQLLTSATVR